jgi:hypothetical protein
MPANTHPDPEHPTPLSPGDYRQAEGLPPAGDIKDWREWMMVGLGLTALVAVLASTLAIVAVATSGGSGETTTVVKHAAAPASPATPKAAPTLAESKGVAFTPFERLDPTLPKVPPR